VRGCQSAGCSHPHAPYALGVKKRCATLDRCVKNCDALPDLLVVALFDTRSRLIRNVPRGRLVRSPRARLANLNLNTKQIRPVWLDHPSKQRAAAVRIALRGRQSTYQNFKNIPKPHPKSKTNGPHTGKILPLYPLQHKSLLLIAQVKRLKPHPIDPPVSSKKLSHPCTPCAKLGAQHRSPRWYRHSTPPI